MVKIIQSETDLLFVSVADRLDCTADVCTLVDYHPDHGRVEPYWRPNHDVMLMVTEMHKVLPPLVPELVAGDGGHAAANCDPTTCPLCEKHYPDIVAKARAENAGNLSAAQGDPE